MEWAKAFVTATASGLKRYGFSNYLVDSGSLAN
jgi:hypothetical protein